MKLTAVFLALAVTALALPARDANRFGGDRFGGNRPNPNNPALNTPPPNPPTVTVPATNNAPTSTPPARNNPSTNMGSSNTDSIDPSLVPSFGITPGIPSTTQTGSCQGNNNINIPCKCPPSKSDFIAAIEKFNARGNIFGSSFSFNTNVADQSPATQLSRVSAAIVALQNFDDTGKGQGCPAGGSAPNFLVVQAQLQKQV